MAQGFKQKEGINFNLVYSPAGMVLYVAVYKGVYFTSIDIKNAFLQCK